MDVQNHKEKNPLNKATKSITGVNKHYSTEIPPNGLSNNPLQNAREAYIWSTMIHPGLFYSIFQKRRSFFGEEFETDETGLYRMRFLWLKKKTMQPNWADKKRNYLWWGTEYTCPLRVSKYQIILLENVCSLSDTTVLPKGVVLVTCTIAPIIWLNSQFPSIFDQCFHLFWLFVGERLFFFYTGVFFSSVHCQKGAQKIRTHTHPPYPSPFLHITTKNVICPEMKFIRVSFQQTRIDPIFYLKKTVSQNELKDGPTQ